MYVSSFVPSAAETSVSQDKCEQASREGGIMGKKIKKGSKLKVNTIGHPSSSKSIKSKVRRIELF
jgi:hypothetical protein